MATGRAADPIDSGLHPDVVPDNDRRFADAHRTAGRTSPAVRSSVVGFASDTAVRAEGGGRYATEIRPGWDIGGKANGGYLLSLVVRAMRDATGRPDPVTVTGHYLSPGHPGPAVITTDVVKISSQLLELLDFPRAVESPFRNFIASRTLVETMIAAMAEEARGILRGDAVEGGTERLFECLDGAGRDTAQV